MSQLQGVSGIWLERIKKLPWPEIVLIVGLIIFDLVIHPLGLGPDRLVHDPAVYRLINPNYLPGDWYTDMAAKSGVYIFYAKLIDFHQFLHLPEELWRQLLYLTSLVILYYSLIKIARLFSSNLVTVPIIAVLHAWLTTGKNQPPWLYGPFIQIDGGLAPRSVGVALSFLALFFLLKDSIFITSAILGLATLIHVSNSLIVFSLFFGVWLLNVLITSRPLDKTKWLAIGKKAGLAIIIYLIAGGWFALYAAHLGGAARPEFTTDKFIWAWIYLRAPYLALPLGSTVGKLKLVGELVVMIVLALIMRRNLAPLKRKAFDTLGWVGLGAGVYFMIFYLFAFVRPWLPGFQFYSIRVIYFTYFAAYLTLALLVVKILEQLSAKISAKLLPSQKLITGFLLVVIAIGSLFYFNEGQRFVSRGRENLRVSGWTLLDDSVSFRDKVPLKYRLVPPPDPIFQYLVAHPQPFLAPANWNGSLYYLPTVVSFKSFGFTVAGLPEWFSRLNAISQNQLEAAYKTQTEAGGFRPVTIDWTKTFSQLPASQILTLSDQYHFDLLVAPQAISYPFTTLVSNGDYRLYQLPKSISH